MEVKSLRLEVGTDVKSLCGNGYNVSAWVDAVVPGTAFNSYVIAGLEKILTLVTIFIR